MGNLARFFEAQIAARSRMYMRSSREAFERAKARAVGVPPLPAYPGDGSTRCLTNCACQWEIIPEVQDDGAIVYNCYWRLGPTEHCPDCIERSRQWNPYTVSS